MPELEEQNLPSIETITSIGRNGSKTSNYPDHRVGDYGDAKKSHELTNQNKMSAVKKGNSSSY